MARCEMAAMGADYVYTPWRGDNSGATTYIHICRSGLPRSPRRSILYLNNRRLILCSSTRAVLCEVCERCSWALCVHTGLIRAYVSPPMRNSEQRLHYQLRSCLLRLGCCATMKGFKCKQSFSEQNIQIFRKSVKIFDLYFIFWNTCTS